MKTYAEILELNTSIPPKLMEIRDQEVEILCGAVHVPGLSLVIPLQNVKYLKTGEKPVPKPPPKATPRPEKEAKRAAAKKSPAKKPTKPKPAVRSPKKVRGE